MAALHVIIPPSLDVALRAPHRPVARPDESVLQMTAQSALGLNESWTTVLDNRGKRIRHPVSISTLDLDNRSHPKKKLSPVDVLVANLVEPLPRDTARLFLCPLTNKMLELELSKFVSRNLSPSNRSIPKGNQNRSSGTCHCGAEK